MNTNRWGKESSSWKKKKNHRRPFERLLAFVCNGALVLSDSELIAVWSQCLWPWDCPQTTRYHRSPLPQGYK